MSDHNPLTLKLNLREKIAYGMGDVGFEFNALHRYSVSPQILYR